MQVPVIQNLGGEVAFGGNLNTLCPAYRFYMMVNALRDNQIPPFPPNIRNVNPNEALLTWLCSCHEAIGDSATMSICKDVHAAFGVDPRLSGMTAESQSLIELSWAARANFYQEPGEYVLDAGLFAETYPCQPRYIRTNDGKLGMIGDKKSFQRKYIAGMPCRSWRPRCSESSGTATGPRCLKLLQKNVVTRLPQHRRMRGCCSDISILSQIHNCRQSRFVYDLAGSPSSMQTSSTSTYDVAVIGAGVFGAWTAYQLQRIGKRVVLIDAYGPANSRSSSGDESRIMRMGYGDDEIYTRSAQRALQLWRELFARVDELLFHQTGVLWLAHKDDPYPAKTATTLEKLGIHFEKLTTTEVASTYPQIGLDGISWAMLEANSGVLSARRAVQAVAREAIANGVEYLQEAVSGPTVPPVSHVQDARPPRG